MKIPGLYTACQILQMHFLNNVLNINVLNVAKRAPAP